MIIHHWTCLWDDTPSGDVYHACWKITNMERDCLFWGEGSGGEQAVGGISGEKTFQKEKVCLVVGYPGYHYHCALEISIYLVYITCFEKKTRLMPGNCFLKTCSFKSNVTPPKTNIHIKNDGLEDVSPFKHGYFGYLCYFSGV